MTDKQQAIAALIEKIEAGDGSPFDGAPETIWADWDKMHPELNGGTWWGEACKATEYRRADLPPTLSDAMELPEVRALRDAMQQVLVEYDEFDAAAAEPASMTDAILEARAALAQFTEAKI
jgi:hypothetical protein